MGDRSWLLRLLAFGLFGFSLAGWLIADEQQTAPDLTVHEWGTFTAIAGKDGRAIEWLPLGLPRFPASTDLPKFVEHISDVNFKLGLRGTSCLLQGTHHRVVPPCRSCSARRSPARRQLESVADGRKHYME